MTKAGALVIVPRMRLLKVAGGALLIGIAASLPAPVLAYTVRSGDTLWDISRHAGISLSQLIHENHLQNPDLIQPGQQLTLPSAPPQGPQPAPAQTAPAPPLGADAARASLIRAAATQHVDPALVLAVANWESGFNQARVSGDGAIGLMQVLPATGAWAGPALLGRRVDLRNPDDNALVGAALLRRYLAEFHDTRLALAAYYQGEQAVKKHGIYPSSLGYVDGIAALRARS